MSVNRFLVCIKLYNVFRFVDPEVKRRAAMKGWYTDGLDTVVRLQLQGEEQPETWRLVVDRLGQDYDDKLLGLAMSSLQKQQGCHTHDDDCAICYQSDNDDDFIVKLQCAHVFHQRCISEWFKLNLSCPLCRSPCLPPS
ncbi:hypothetical protein RND81_04G192200 [Saponaria officinalis]|uniref:RING-type domain-containing protein n=1 Tax=Saponaria officinalis TaxID=3572 RepID=A0AAW1LNV0_SAPOF